MGLEAKGQEESLTNSDHSSYKAAKESRGSPGLLLAKRGVSPTPIPQHLPPDTLQLYFFIGGIHSSNKYLIESLILQSVFQVQRVE